MSVAPHDRVSPQAHAARGDPRQAFHGAAPWAVLAADPAVEAGGVDALEKVGVVHLAVVGLAAVGRAGDLIVAGERGELLDGRGDVALLDLAVVEVELE